ncbi:hypothetical protein [Roseicella sp. DB1501]|uniref:hypothetical protein n=1 Tax=Roseicella sp. DB1501 TaxID=2730925 RepID=UPI001492EBC0|nr:hypothetical protein [Roseicella sp. DB1501]NOG72688.1 hypothetical protein [Roseicella sp. DB1501]
MDDIVFTSDLLKIDDRLAERLPNPQSINIEWLHALFAPILASLTGSNCRIYAAEDYPNPLSRLAVYRRLQRDFSSAGWASLYDRLDDPDVECALASRFAGALIVSFEMPPYLEAILRRHEIGFIDLTIHPIRYLADYMFGIRSNIEAVSQRLHATQIDPEHFQDAARISAARSVRVWRRKPIEPGSAVFLGQIEIDASLIHQGRLHDVEAVEGALLDLSTRHRKVYYKAHPHRKDLDRIKQLVASLPRVEWLDANIYDLLALPEIDVVASLSSGTLVEAGFFGRNTRRYLARSPLVDVSGAAHEEVFRRGQYVAAPPAVFGKAYWAYLLGASDEAPPVHSFDLMRDALRTTLNMQWGR